MEQARTGIRYALVAATHETLIGLLAVTGMRVSEAIKLDRADVDWTNATLLVRESKFDNSRYLPVHPSTLDALERYAALRDRLCPDPLGPSFLVSLRHGRLYGSAVQKTFRRLCQNAGVGATAPFRPKLHDLRHSLAVNTLLGWYATAPMCTRACRRSRPRECRRNRVRLIERTTHAYEILTAGSIRKMLSARSEASLQTVERERCFPGCRAVPGSMRSRWRSATSCFDALLAGARTARRSRVRTGCWGS